MSTTIVKLENSIQHYAWGSRDAIARLQQRATPSPEPEAELWIVNDAGHSAGEKGIIDGLVRATDKLAGIDSAP